MIQILSIDCANKSLALSCIIFNDNWVNEINQLIKKFTTFDEESYYKLLVDINEILNNMFIIRWCKVVDILEGKKVKDCDAITRVQALKKYLLTLDDTYVKYVIIEDQMSLNEKSRGVYYCLLFHYAHKNLVSVKAAQKNKNINFGAGNHCEFVAKYSKAWSANKAHSAANFLSYLKTRKQPPVDIKGKQLSDVADTFLQAYVYCTRYLTNSILG
jgi:hypothetical protein